MVQNLAEGRCYQQMMQKVSWNISTCAESIKEFLKFFKNIRNDESFENYMQISSELCKALETEPDFPTEISVQCQIHQKAMKQMKIFN